MYFLILMPFCLPKRDLLCVRKLTEGKTMCSTGSNYSCTEINFEKGKLFVGIARRRETTDTATKDRAKRMRRIEEKKREGQKIREEVKRKGVVD